MHRYVNESLDLLTICHNVARFIVLPGYPKAIVLLMNH